MIWKRLFPLPVATALAFGVFACANVGGDSSLTLESFPSTLAVDSTAGPFTAVKKFRDDDGRLQTINDYTDFYLVSEDTTVVRVLSGRGVMALKAGKADVIAHDNESTLMSAAYSITVTQ